jgi:hypothetical protein
LLAVGHALAGEHILASSVVYPPVVPLLILGFTGIWGPYLGCKVLAVVASLLPAVGCYLVLRASNLGWAAAILACFLAAASATGEAMAWGGYPQLIGLGLIVPFLWMLDRFIRDGKLAHAFVAGTLLALTLATSDIVGGLAVVAGITLAVLGLVIQPPDWRAARRLSLGLALLIVPCIPLIPLYVGLAAAVLHNYHPASAGATPTVTGSLATIEFLYRDFKLFWRIALGLAVLAPVALLSMRRTSLWLTSSAMLFPALGLLLLAGEPRLIYFLSPAAILGLGCWLEYLRKYFSSARWFTPAVVLVLATALGGQIASGLNFYAAQARFYTILTPGVAAGIDWLDQHTDQSILVAVSSTREQGMPIGWWVEGVGHRRTLSGSALTWLVLPDQRDRAIKAAQIFDPTIPIDEGLLRARQLHAAYIFVDKEWPGFQAWSRSRQGLPPRAIVIDNESLLLLRTD